MLKITTYTPKYNQYILTTAVYIPMIQLTSKRPYRLEA
jgi:hypothetical protein